MRPKLERSSLTPTAAVVVCGGEWRRRRRRVFLTSPNLRRRREIRSLLPSSRSPSSSWLRYIVLVAEVVGLPARTSASSSSWGGVGEGVCCGIGFYKGCITSYFGIPPRTTCDGGEMWERVCVVEFRAVYGSGHTSRVRLRVGSGRIRVTRPGP